MLLLLHSCKTNKEEENQYFRKHKNRTGAHQLQVKQKRKLKKKIPAFFKIIIFWEETPYSKISFPLGFFYTPFFVVAFEKEQLKEISKTFHFVTLLKNKLYADEIRKKNKIALKLKRNYFFWWFKSKTIFVKLKKK